MPMNPVSAEKTAPITKKTLRPMRTSVVCRRQQKEHQRDQDDKDGKGLELAGEIGRRALLNRFRDVLHALGALACRENLAYEPARDSEGEQGHGSHHDDDSEVTTTQGNRRAIIHG